MPDPRFEILEHTADAGIVAHGESLQEVFTNAALGMFTLMVEIDGVNRTEERHIEVEADDREALLVRWLTELLYYVDAQEMLFGAFSIEEIGDKRLRAKAFGERIDAERHRLHFGIKAVTRHMLEVARANDGYRAQVLFDI